MLCWYVAKGVEGTVDLSSSLAGSLKDGPSIGTASIMKDATDKGAGVVGGRIGCRVGLLKGLWATLNLVCMLQGNQFYEGK
jgi:hypothetical protein